MNSPNHPLVSVIIPFFNPGTALLDAVRSVFAQTCEHWELILLDDGSTDGSLATVSRIRDPRVHVVSDGRNRGLVYRLNQMPALAHGEFIARMDADDLMHPERLERQLQWFASHPETDVLATAIVSMTQGWHAVAVRDTGKIDMAPVSVLTRGGIVHPTVMARREWFGRNAYDDAFPRAEDRELWLRTLRQAHFAKLQEPLYFYTEVDAVQMAKYQASYRSERRAIWRHGPRLAGWPMTLVLVLRSLAKSLVLRVLGVLGQQNAIVQRRLDGADSGLQGYQSCIDSVLAVRLPGVDVQ